MFLGVSLFIMFLSGLSEKDAVNSFISGASEVIGVALIIGLARAINIIMETGMISDTLLYYSTNLVLGMNKGLFSIVLVIIYIFRNIYSIDIRFSSFINADTCTTGNNFGVSRTVVIDAFAWGQGLVLFVTPTGLIFVVLQIVGIPYNKWLKFVLPSLMFMMSIFVFMMIYLKTII